MEPLPTNRSEILIKLIWNLFLLVFYLGVVLFSVGLIFLGVSMLYQILFGA